MPASGSCYPIIKKKKVAVRTLVSAPPRVVRLDEVMIGATRLVEPDLAAGDPVVSAVTWSGHHSPNIDRAKTSATRFE